MAAVRPTPRRNRRTSWMRRVGRWQRMTSARSGPPAKPGRSRDASGRHVRTAALGAGLALGPCLGLWVWAARLDLIGRGRARRPAAISEVSRAILADEGDAAVVAQVARHVRRLTGADRALALVPDLGSGVAVVAADPQVGAVADPDALVSEPLLAEASRWRAPRVVPGVDLRHGSLALSGTAVVAPLVVTGRPVGVVLAVARGKRSFRGRDVRTLQLFAPTVAAALDYVRLRKESESAMILPERERIAGELQDGVIKTLFEVGMQLQSAATRATDRWFGERLEVAVRGVDKAINDLRSYVFAVRSQSDRSAR